MLFVPGHGGDGEEESGTTDGGEQASGETEE